MPLHALWYRFLLRFKARHRQLGCLDNLGTSVCGEPMWYCRLHNKAW